MAMSSIRRILILSANPKDTSRLRLGEELREIEDGLSRSRYRDHFVVHAKLAARLRDLRRAMLDYDPHIVHFCGHGEEDGLVVEDENGNAVLISPDALSGLFELFSSSVECVLLNACYSVTQANAINRYIPYVIGMNSRIEDKTAIEFAVGFYDALGAGKSVEEAFKFGCNATDFEGIPAGLAPLLQKRLNPLRLQRKTIAVVCPMFGASRIYYTELLSAIVKQANQQGYELLIVPITDTGSKRPLFSHFPQVSSVDGAILITCQVDGTSWLEELAARNIPVVLLHDNIDIDKARGYSVVSHIRPRLGALSDLVQHLIIEHGCKNISVVTVNPANHAIRAEKMAVIASVLRDAQPGFKCENNTYHIKEYSHEEGIYVVDRIIDCNLDTDAIVCLADITAIGVMQRLKELDLHSRIRVTGFDNVEVAWQNNLTTIDQELRLTGERALVDLHEAVRSQCITEFQKMSYIPTVFIPRGSCCTIK